MSNLLTVIQGIAVNAVKATNPMAFCYGTVTSASPLKIRLNDGTLEVSGSSIMLTESVVEKTITIKKHDHTENDALVDYTATGNMGAPILFAPLGVDLYILNPNFDPSQPRTDTDEAKGTGSNPKYILNPDIPSPTTLPMKHSHGINTSTLDAWVTEFGVKQPVDPESYNQSGDEVVITINRGLEKYDKVIMLSVSEGQKFIVLSRIFKRDDETDDD